MTIKDCVTELGFELATLELQSGMILTALWNLGSVVQSVVSLMSSSVVNTLTVVVSTMSNSQVFC